jgi:hypothetical protein
MTKVFHINYHIGLLSQAMEGDIDLTYQETSGGILLQSSVYNAIF